MTLGLKSVGREAALGRVERVEGGTHQRCLLFTFVELSMTVYSTGFKIDYTLRRTEERANKRTAQRQVQQTKQGQHNATTPKVPNKQLNNAMRYPQTQTQFDFTAASTALTFFCPRTE